MRANYLDNRYGYVGNGDSLRVIERAGTGVIDNNRGNISHSAIAHCRQLPSGASLQTAAIMVLSCLAGILLAGCSAGHEKETAPARGVVTLDGKPIPGGSVMFVPESGRGAVGMISADGTFVLSTYGNADGAIIGRHKVVVHPARPSFESDELPINYIAVPARYQSSGSSKIEVEVQPGKENDFDLKLVTSS